MSLIVFGGDFLLFSSPITSSPSCPSLALVKITRPSLPGLPRLPSPGSWADLPPLALFPHSGILPQLKTPVFPTRDKDDHHVARPFRSRVAVLWGNPPPATDFEVGVEAWGRGDYDTALREFRPLAEQGHAQAQVNLGILYSQGQGVPKDYVLAHMWLNLAEAKGVKATVKMRDLLEKNMTPAQLAEAQRLAGEWTPKGKE